MSGRRRWFVAGAGALLLVLLAAGAALAQPAPTPQARENPTNYGQYFLDQLAKTLNINRDQLNAAIKTAGSQTIDKEVADGRLTADQATQQKQRLEQGNGTWPGIGGGFVPRGPGKLDARGSFVPGNGYAEGIAKALGLTTDELNAQLKAGKSVADLAKEKNVAADAIKSAVVAAVGAQLDQSVAAGKMTAAQATTVKDQLNRVPAEKFLTLAGMGVKAVPSGKAMPFGGPMPRRAPAAPKTSGPTT
jgi:hypothetical protein